MAIQQYPTLLSEEIAVLFSKTVSELSGRSQAGISKLLDQMGQRLHAYRAASAADQWQRFIDFGRSHPIFQILQQDPFTSRAFAKPRGYAGDAVLLDYIYGTGSYAQVLRRTSHAGRRIYNHNRMASAAIAVRNRRDLLAREIDSALAYGDHVRILSVAAGHLREAEMVHWVGVDNLELFLAVDQDWESLEEIDRQGYHAKLFTRQQSIREILSGKMKTRDFDLIYVAGLYDYLDGRVATRLTELLFHKLRAGGKLLVANFLPTAADAGYMELFMDWFLIYRDLAELQALAAAIGSDELGGSRAFVEGSGQIGFLELIRAQTQRDADKVA